MLPLSIDSARLTPEVILIFFDCRDKTYCYEKCIFLGHLLICIRQTATLSCFSEKQFELYVLYISSGIDNALQIPNQISIEL